MGLMQWLLVASFVAFFLTYGVDIFLALRAGSVPSRPVEPENL
jgi:hypothetical protein